MDIQWEEPPTTELAGRLRSYASTKMFVAELKKRPGQWAKYPTSDAQSSVRNAQQRLRELGMETVASTDADGKRQVHARYVPQD